MTTKVFVDGQEGTTGLQIHERLQGRSDLEILSIDPALRKDIAERKKLLNAADIVFLCLPDSAAIESVALIENDHTCVIDASTAHRTNPDWVYGLAEVKPEQRELIKNSKRIANPGCYATGFVLAVAPLVQAGVVKTDSDFVCHAITGYSGGGKKLIALYEETEHLTRDAGSSPRMNAPRAYGLGLQHKHLPEMTLVSGIKKEPHFNPVVGPYYKGMAVNVPILPGQLTSDISAQELQEVMEKHYAGQEFVKVLPYEENPALDGGFLDATVCNDSNRADVHVFGQKGHLQVTVILDNLGKGASGAAVQNMNIVMGIDENTGLES